MFYLINKKIQFIHNEIVVINSNIERNGDSCGCRNLIFTLNDRRYNHLEYHFIKNHLNMGEFYCPYCYYTDLASNFNDKCPACEINIKIGVEIIIVWRK